MGIERLLLSKNMQTAAGDIFLERFGQLVNLSRSGQLAVKELLAAHLGAGSGGIRMSGPS
ncbi:MAG TPA: hypothetical protein VHG93_06320 [Longimicrobium sp.]|nr:hypothetical protein [Longimicrobium sp.]